MHDWDDLRFFLAIARTGSVTAAAEKLAVNQSTVSRRINAFEASMNVRLFERFSTGYVLTAEGEELRTHALRMEEEAHAITRMIMGKNVALDGPIRVTTSLVLLRYTLLPYLQEFTRQHPAIELRMDLANNLYNLSQREADVAIRITRESAPENLVSRQLGQIRFGVYGSSDYLRRWRQGAGSQPLHWIGEDINDLRPNWLPADISPLQLVMRSNDVLATLSAIKIGMGVGRLPTLIGEAEPGLEAMDVEMHVPPVPVSLITHADMRRVKRVRVFNDFIAERLRETFAN